MDKWVSKFTKVIFKSTNSCISQFRNKNSTFKINRKPYSYIKFPFIVKIGFFKIFLNKILIFLKIFLIFLLRTIFLFYFLNNIYQFLFILSHLYFFSSLAPIRFQKPFCVLINPKFSGLTLDKIFNFEKNFN
jgi:hypothetical protein